MTMFHVSSRDLVWVLKWPVLGGWKRDLHLGESPLVAKVTSRESPQIICRLKWHKSVEIHGKNPPKVEKKYTSPPPKKNKKTKTMEKMWSIPFKRRERRESPKRLGSISPPLCRTQPAVQFTSVARMWGEPLTSLKLSWLHPMSWKGKLWTPMLLQVVVFLVHKLLSKLQKNNIMFFVFVWPFGCIGLKAGFTVCFFICYVGLWIIVANSVTNVVTNDLLTS